MKKNKYPPKTKFLFCPDEENEELYLLHLEYPACLMWVRQEKPVTLVVIKIFDNIEDKEDILNMPFLEDAKIFFKNQMDKNIDEMDTMNYFDKN